MAHARPAHINKDGKVTSYEIYTSNGRDINGKPIKPRMSWKPSQGMSESQIRKELERVKVEFENKIKRGEDVATKATFAEYAKDFMAAKEKTVAHRTTMYYRHMLERINVAIGHKKLRELLPRHIVAFMNNLRESGIRDSESKAVATRLVAVLKEQGMTHAKLAAEAAISEATVSVAAQGNKVSLDSAAKMAAVLGLPVEKLFMVNKNTEPLSEKTIREHYALIHLILEDAYNNGCVDFNACGRVKAPVPKKKEIESLQTDEIDRIMDALDNDDIPLKWRVITHLLLATGCRRGEIAGLRWSKVNFATGELLIDKAMLYSKERGLHEGSTKTKQTRTVAIPDETLDLLKEYRAWYEREKAAYGELWQRAQNDTQIDKERRWRGKDYLFVQDGGWPMHPDSINTWMAKFTKQYGLPHIHPHKFRHTQASLLIYDGNNVASVAKRLGHAQVSTTMNIYTHAIDAAEERLKESVGNVLYRNRRKSG